MGRNRKCPGGLGLEISDAGEDLLGGSAGAEQFPQFGVTQHEPELGQDPKMGRDAGTHDHEDRMDGLAIDGIERDRVPEKRQRNEGLIHVEENRIPYVGYRDAVPDPGGTHRLTSIEHREEECTIHFCGERKGVDNILQHAGLVVPTSHVPNPTGAQ
jgi:hypothetical protein